MDGKIETKTAETKVDNDETKSWKFLTSYNDTVQFKDMERDTRDTCTSYSFYECKRQYIPVGSGGAKYHKCCTTSALQLAVDGLAIPNTYNDAFERQVVYWTRVKGSYGEYDDSTVCYSAHPRSEWRYTHWVIVKNDGTVHVCGKTAQTSRVNTYFSAAIYPCALEAYWLVVRAEAQRGNKLAALIAPLLKPFSAEASGCRPHIRNLYSACIVGLFEGEWRHRREYKSETDKAAYLQGLEELGHDVIFDHSIPKPTRETIKTEFRGISIVRRPGDDLAVKVPHAGCTEASFDYSVRGPYGHLFDRYAKVVEVVDAVAQTVDSDED